MNHHWILPKQSLGELVSELHRQGYQVLSPQVAQGQVGWHEVHHASDLKQGYQDAQAAGSYRLQANQDDRWFSITHGAPSLKNLTYKPRQSVVHIIKTESGISFQAEPADAEKTAVIGVRPCDVAALQIQEKVFTAGEYQDDYFKANRDALLIVAVNCTRSAATCFCTSMACGPQAGSGFDISLTELDEHFLLQTGSSKGEAMVAALALEPAPASLQQQAQALVDACAASQQKKMPQHNYPQQLYQARHSNHWQEVANHCLSCANCTMVCPTCFCHSIEETPDMARQRSERVRVWDSCFNPDHGYIHGKNMRPTTADRYRMWMSHKLGTWVEQFGSSGCTGCGRCISWCPAGIDLVEEAIAVLEENI